MCCPFPFFFTFLRPKSYKTGEECLTFFFSTSFIFFFFGKMKLKWGRYGGEPGSINGRKSLAPGHLGSPAKVGTHVRERNIFFFFLKKKIYFFCASLRTHPLAFYSKWTLKFSGFYSTDLMTSFNDQVPPGGLGVLLVGLDGW